MTTHPISEPLRRQLMIKETFGSLSDIQRRTGVDTGQLSRFINKKREFMSGTLDTLAEHLGMELIVIDTGNTPSAGECDETDSDDGPHANTREVVSANGGRQISIADDGIMSPWLPALGQRRNDRPCTFPQPMF